VTQADGTFSVFIGNGQPLVLGTSSFTMQSIPSPTDAEKTIVTMASQNGASVIIPESQLTGGTLGGLVSFRSQSLDATQNGIGRIALAVAQDVNNILQSGQDLNGNLGSALFNVPSPSVTASTLNTGTGDIGASIVDRNYRVVFGAAGAYTVYDAATNASLATGTAGAGETDIYVDGVKLVVNNGNMTTAGDAFDINPGNAAGSRAVAESTNTYTASLTGAALTFPVTITAGTNDTLSVTLNGTTRTVTVAAGSYATSALLAGAVQTAMNTAFPTLGAGVTVSASGNSIVLTSQQAVAGASLVVGAGAGATSMFGGPLTGTSATMDSSGSNIQALDTSDYQLDYISNAGGNFTFRLTRLSDGSKWTGSGTTYQGALDNLASQQQTGFTLTAPAAGTLAVGDSFGILPTRYAAGTISVAATDTNTIAAAAPFVASTGTNNTGKAAISAGSVVNTGHLPLAATVTFTYNSTTKTLSTPPGAAPWGGLSIPYDPTAQTASTITVNGLSFTLSGTPANGDTFTLGPNTNGVSDNRNAELLQALQTAKTLSGAADSLTANATASFASAYAQIVSQVGNTTNQVQVTAAAQQTLVDEAQTARDSLSGVNLDEEAANLIAFQQAYQASAKVLTVASKLFDQILALGG
jgi:flagellar hook-associated protein 1 FlgK